MTRLYNSNDKVQSRTHMLGYFIIEDINLKENIVCENLSFQNSFKKKFATKIFVRNIFVEKFSWQK